MILAFACGDDSAPGSTSFGTNGTTTGTQPGTTGEATTHVADTGTSEEGSSDDSTPVACPETHSCLPAAPEGWGGPVALLESATVDEEPTCDSKFPEIEAVAFQGLIAPPPSCGCSCGEAEGMSCSTTVIARYWGSDSTCSTGTPAQYEFNSIICNNLPSILPSGTHWTVQPVQTTGGNCEPIPHVSIVPAEFETRFAACGGAEIEEGCPSGQVCAPRLDEADDARICIWQAGEHQCPTGYMDRNVVFADIDDDRACSDCTCGDPVGLCNSAEVRLTQNPCSVPYSAILSADGQCRQTFFETRSALFVPGAPTAFCQSSPVMPVGTATATGSTTFCCR